VRAGNKSPMGFNITSIITDHIMFLLVSTKWVVRFVTVSPAEIPQLLSALFTLRTWVQRKSNLNEVPSVYGQSVIKVNKIKAITVTGRGVYKGCEMLRILSCLDNRLTDGGKFVSSTHRASSISKNHYFSAPHTQSWWRLSKLQEQSVADRIKQNTNKN
jgi:hypothetical protein